ncbi:MAG: DMT family transporter [Bacteroidales bacterium]|nr:DMT family transporter [Bacteroidales bacterium]
MKDQKRAYLFAISAILMWSTVASAFKYTLQYIDFPHLLFYASATAVVVLFVLIATTGKPALFRQIDKGLIFRSALRGFLNPFAYYLVLLKAYDLLKAQEAGTLNYIWPITLVLLSIPFLGQKIGFKSILAIFTSFFGILIISTEGKITTLTFREPLGVVLAVGSSLFWALYWILNMRDKQDELLKLFLNFCFGTLFIAITILLKTGMYVPDIRGIAGSVYAGVFEMGLTYFLWLKALKLSATTARVANLVYLSPFVSLIIISVTLGERILPATVIGLIFIIAGIVFQHSAAEGKGKQNT